MKKLDVRFTLSLLASLALVACGGSKNSNESKDVMGLAQDYKSESAQFRPLTPSETKFLRELFTSGRTIPTSSLFFDSYKTIEEKNKALARLSPMGKALLARVRQDCTVDKGQDMTLSEAQIGKTGVKVREKSITGARCPVEYVSTDTTNTTITSQDEKTGATNGSVVSTNSYSEKIRDNEFKSGLTTVESSSQSRMQIQYVNAVAIVSEPTSGYIRGGSTSEGKLKLGNGITATMAMKAEIFQGPRNKNIQFLMVVRFSNGVNFSIAVIRKQGEARQFYINGESYTEERMQRELGWDDLISLEI